MPLFGVSKREPKTETSIVICDRCDGVGYLGHNLVVDYHKRLFKTEWHDCYACNASGRLRQTVTTTWETLIENKPEDS